MSKIRKLTTVCLLVFLLIFSLVLTSCVKKDLTLDKTTAEIEAGDTVTVTVKYGSSTLSGEKLTWSLDKEGIVGIEEKDEGYLITGVVKGVVTVTIRYEKENKEVSIKITVNDTKGDYAAALAAAKKNKLAELTALLTAYKQGDYSSSNWAILSGYISAATVTVNDATTVEAVNAVAVADIRTACEKVLTKAAEENAQLNAAKAAKTAELTTLLAEYKQSDYSEANWDTLKEYVSAAKDKVKNAVDIVAIDAVSKEEIKVQCDAVLTLAKEAALSLAEAKTAKQAEIDALFATYKDYEYSGTNWERIQSIITSAKAAVKALTKLSDVLSYNVTTVKYACDAVNTYSYEVMIARSIKINSLNNLLTSYSQADYSSSNWAVLTGYIIAAKNTVNGASYIPDIDEVNVTAVKAQCDAVKTIVQEAQALAAAKTAKESALTALLATYSQANYSASNWTTLAGYITAAKNTVSGATNISIVEAVSVNGVKTQCDAVKTIAQEAQELADAKTDKVNELTALQNTYVEENYGSANWTALTGYVSSAKATINSYTSIADVSAFSVSGVKTQCDALSKDALIAAKNTKKGDLDDLLDDYDQDSYSTLNWGKLNGYITAAKNAVDALATKTDVNGFNVNAIKSQCDEVKCLVPVASVAELIAAISDDEGDGILLTADIEEDITVDVDKPDLEINLGGHTTGRITIGSSIFARKMLRTADSEATIIIKGGKIETDEEYGIVVQGGSSVSIYLSGLTVEAEIAALYTNGIYSGASIVGENCTFKGKQANISAGAYLAANYIYDFTECTFEGAGGIHIKSGTLALSGCTLTANGDYSAPSYVADGFKITGNGLMVEPTLGYTETLNIIVDSCAITSANGNSIEEYALAAEDETPIAYASIIIRGNCIGTLSNNKSQNKEIEAHVNTLDQLTDAIKVNWTKRIVLIDDITGIDKQIVIDRALVLDGSNYRLAFAADMDVKSGVLIRTNNVTVKNLTVDRGMTVKNWKSAYALQVYDAESVVLENVTLTKGDGGLLVNGSTVTVKGTLDVSGNYFGGIEIGKGGGVASDSILTLDTGAEIVNTTEFCDTPTIWIEQDDEGEYLGELKAGEFVIYNKFIESKNQLFYYLSEDLSKAIVSVKTYDQLVEAIKWADKIVFLNDITKFGDKYLGDFDINAYTRDYSLEIDLNGFKLLTELNIRNKDGHSAKITIKNGTVGVLKSEDLWYGLMINGDNKVEINLEAATFYGYYGGLYTNGTFQGASITADNCHFEGYCTDDNLGAYLAANYTYNFTDCEFTGAGGIHIKSGTLTLTDCTLTADGAYALPSYHGSGANVTGNGLMIEPSEGYGKRLIITVTGGAITSENGKQIGVAQFTDTYIANLNITGYDICEYVSTLVQLERAITRADEIVLLNDITSIIKQIKVDNPVVLDGNGYILTFEDADTVGDCGARSGVVIVSDGAHIKNLTVDRGKDTGVWKSDYALQVFDAQNVVLENLALKNGVAGLLVNGSSVTVKGTLDVSGNYFGGMEIGKGSSSSSLIFGLLTLDTGAEIINTTEFCDTPTIWIEKDGEGEYLGELKAGEFVIYNKFIESKNQLFYYLSEDLSKAIVSVKTYDQLVEAIKWADKIVFLNDITVPVDDANPNSEIAINAYTRDYDLVIDLNGKTLNGRISVRNYNFADSSYKDYSATVIIQNGTVTSPTDYGIVVIGNEDVDLTLINLNVSAQKIGLGTNGTTAGAKVTISGGSYKGAEFGAYLPGNYTYNFTNCEFTGATGIHIKSGTLALNNCTLMADGAYATPTYNGNGANVTGNGLMVEPTVGYFQTLDVIIDGGSITSANGYAVEEYALAKDGVTPVEYATVSIKGDCTLTSGKASKINSQNSVIQANISTLAQFTEAVEWADAIILANDITFTGTTATDFNQFVKADARSYDLVIDLNGFNFGGCLGFSNFISAGKYYEQTLTVTVKDNSAGETGSVGSLSNPLLYYGIRVQGNGGVSVILDGIKIYGYYGGMQTLGTCAGASITAVGCSFEGGEPGNDNLGAYLAAGYIYSFEGCTFTGATGIHIKSGTLTLTNCTLTADGAYALPSYHGSGANITGNGLMAEATDGYNATLSITIDGGSITSANGYAIGKAQSYPMSKKDSIYQANITFMNSVNLEGKLGEESKQYISIAVSSLAQLKEAIAMADEIDTIALWGNITGINEQIVIDKTVVINGNDKALTFASGADVKSGVLIQADNVMIKNLTVNRGKESGAWSSAYALQVYVSNGIVLENVTLTKGDGGLLVNGSTVTVKCKLNVSNNIFGGIEIGKGKDVTSDSILTLDTGAEIINTSETLNTPTVWIEQERDEDGDYIEDAFLGELKGVAGLLHGKFVASIKQMFYYIDINLAND